MSQRVLVTGATGFIGGAVVTQLVERGHEVFALVRDRAGAASLALPTEVRQDVWPATQEGLRALVRRNEITVCLHLAAQFVAEHSAADVARLIDTNVGLTAAVIDAATGHVRRFISAGTIWRTPAGSTRSAASLYAASKQAGQEIVRYFADSVGLETLTINIPDSYGPRDNRRKVIDLLLEAVSHGRTLQLSPGEQLMDLLHVDDIAAAFVRAIESDTVPVGGEVALTSGRLLTLRQLAQIVTDVTGRPVPAHWGALPYRARESFQAWDQQPGLPGWQPEIDLHEGIRRLWNPDLVHVRGGHGVGERDEPARRSPG